MRWERPPDVRCLSRFWVGARVEQHRDGQRVASYGACGERRHGVFECPLYRPGGLLAEAFECFGQPLVVRQDHRAPRVPARCVGVRFQPCPYPFPCCHSCSSRFVLSGALLALEAGQTNRQSASSAGFSQSVRRPCRRTCSRACSGSAPPSISCWIAHAAPASAAATSTGRWYSPGAPQGAFGSAPRPSSNASIAGPDVSLSLVLLV